MHIQTRATKLNTDISNRAVKLTQAVENLDGGRNSVWQHAMHELSVCFCCKQIQRKEKKYKVEQACVTNNIKWGSVFPVSPDSTTLSQFEHSHFPETDWTSAVISVELLTPLLSCLSPSETFDKAFVDFSFPYLQSTQSEGGACRTFRLHDVAEASSSTKSWGCLSHTAVKNLLRSGASVPFVILTLNASIVMQMTRSRSSLSALPGFF